MKTFRHTRVAINFGLQKEECVLTWREDRESERGGICITRLSVI
jgi:hypothetical protein